MPILNWIGKEYIINHDKEVPLRLLKKIEKKSINNSDNLIIEGDNLEALKALLPFYQNTIKCIYIDPPYNTGKQTWRYNDNVDAPKIRKWLGSLVDFDDLTRHDKWACMMYPRLKLLQDLLSQDGLIFVSIGDDEIQTLKMIMNEIFLPENFIAQLIWNTEGSTDNQLEIKTVHEYVLLYGKNSQLKSKAISNVIAPDIESGKLFKDHIENTAVKNSSANPASVIKLPVGFPCEVNELELNPTKISNDFYKKVENLNYISREVTSQYNLHYPIRQNKMLVKKGKLSKTCEVFSGWGNAKKLNDFIKNNCKPLIEDGEEFSYFISKKGVVIYKKERKEARNILSVIRKVGTTTTAQSHLENMNLKFPYPKPVELIKYLIKIGSKPDSIILDSFAGSGTTGEAILSLNKDDGGNRKFILVELEEEICQNVTSERVKKVIKGYKTKKKETIKGLGGGFQYTILAEPLFDKNGKIIDDCSFEDLASFIYFMETKEVINRDKIKDNFIGEFQNVKYYLIFADKKTLDQQFLNELALLGKKVVYAEKCTLDDSQLEECNIEFKQIPYDIKKF